MDRKIFKGFRDILGFPLPFNANRLKVYLNCDYQTEFRSTFLKEHDLGYLFFKLGNYSITLVRTFLSFFKPTGQTIKLPEN